ncbi:hypothetical protein N665_0437s0012 [Sinapis alba]|nr:hypothetical protein N665_0437s0012 [Sinapis alba]
MRTNARGSLPQVFMFFVPSQFLFPSYFLRDSELGGFVKFIFAREEVQFWWGLASSWSPKAVCGVISRGGVILRFVNSPLSCLQGRWRVETTVRHMLQIRCLVVVLLLPGL